MTGGDTHSRRWQPLCAPPQTRTALSACTSLTFYQTEANTYHSQSITFSWMDLMKFAPFHWPAKIIRMLLKAITEIRVGTLLNTITTVISIAAVGFGLFLIHYDMRQQALMEAKSKAEILINQNLATHQYFTEILKPSLFELSDTYHPNDYFAPAWMSSSYAVQHINAFFNILNPSDYYSKDAAIHARNPLNEANTYERAFIEEINGDPSITERTEVRTFDGQPYLIVLRAGEVMTEDCLQCHGTPSDAPSDLLAKYGSERSFNRQIGEITSAISLRIPLSAAYAEADRSIMQISTVVIVLLVILLAAHYYIYRYLLFKPLRILHAKASQISYNKKHLGEQIPIPFSRDIAELTASFNTLSTSLRRSHDHLEQRIQERTAAYQAANQQLQHEITERKRTEIVLQESERKLKLLIDRMIDAFALFECVYDEEGSFREPRVIFINQACEQMTGLVNAEISGKLVHEFFPGTEDYWIEEFRKVVVTGIPNSFEGYHQTSGKWYKASIYLPGDDKHQFCAVFQDVTERHRAEEALQASAERFRMLVEHGADIITLIDEDGKVLFHQPSLHSEVNYSVQDLVGREGFELLPSEDYEILHNQVFSGVIASPNQSIPLTFRLKFEDGSIRSYEGNAVNLLQEPAVQAILLNYRDITERIIAERELNRRVTELEVLYEISLAISALTNPKLIAQTITRILSRKLEWHHAAVLLYHADIDFVELLHLHYPQKEADELSRAAENMQTAISRPGEGLSGWVIEHGQIVHLGEITTDPRYLPTFQNVHSGMYVPINAGDTTIGCISIESSQPDAFDENHERLLITVAAQAAAALENARHFNETRRWASQLISLVQTGRKLSETMDLSEIYQRLTHALIQLLPDICALFISLYDEANGKILCVSAFCDGEYLDHNTLPVLPLDPQGEGRQSKVILTGQPLIIDDMLEKQLPTNKVILGDLSRTPRSAIYVPLISQYKVIGLIQAQSYQPARFRDDSEILDLVANTAAIAIENARLYQAVQQELLERQHAEGELRTLNLELEQRVQARTAELQLTNLELARASRMKDEFLASMSHELRTPLTGVLNISEVLQEQIFGSLNEKQLKSLRVIEDSGRHLLGLINDILDLSKIEAGQLELQRETFLVNDICQSSLQLVKGMAQKKQQYISFTIEPVLLTLNADPRRLKQILVNLLSNAVKFTPEGGKLSLEVTGDSEAKAVHFTVHDTGIGIAPEDLPRLFRPFTQLDSSLSRQQTGTGLGLALVQRMTDLHGGSVSLESFPGEGSHFTVSLPWCTGDEQVGKPASEENPHNASSPSLAASGSLILLVDDNVTNLSIYTDYLKSHNFRTLVAYSGEEGDRLAHQNKPDMILMDIQMPGMDGLETIRRLRSSEDPEVSGIPILALTALAMPGDRQRCLDAGADEYLSKPVSLKRLVTVIQEILSQRSSTGTAAGEAV